MRLIAPSTDELKENILSTIRGSDWFPRLRLFLMSSEFELILQEILSDFALSYRISPPLKHVFRAFTSCPYEKLSVLIYTEEQSEYLQKYDGIAFSQSFRGKPDNTLKRIFEELKRNDSDYKGSCDLARWSGQGALCVPHALTTIINAKDSHVELWKQFFNSLFDHIRYDRKDVVIVLVGESVWNKAENFPDNVVLKYTHPNHGFPAPWSSNMFVDINKKLKQLNKKEITW